MWLLALVVTLLLLIVSTIIVGALLQRRRGAKLKLEQTPWVRAGGKYLKKITLRNEGNFHALVLEALVRPKEMIPCAHPEILRPDQDVPKPYFKAVIVKPEGSSKEPRSLHLLLSIDSEPCDMELLIIWYDNRPMRIRRWMLSGELAEDDELSKELVSLMRNPEATSSEEKLELLKVNESVTCLHTPIIHNYDELLEYIVKGLRSYVDEEGATPKVVAISESVVSIVQGRAVSVYDIKPGFLSESLTGFFHEDSSMSSPYAFHLVSSEVGLWRVLMGIWVGILGKMLGKRGWFYVIAGRQAASVDDCAGTTPPFDKYVVLSPSEPDDFSVKLREAIGERLGKELSEIPQVAVVDVNDLGAVDVLGATAAGLERLELSQALKEHLRTNPQGNEDERRPIVFIR